MELVAQQPPGKLIMIGLRYREATKEYVWLPDIETVNDNRVLLLAREVFEQDFKTVHGVVYGTQLRRLPTIPYTTWGLLFRWQTHEPANYVLKMIRPQQPHTFKGEFTNFTTLLLYSFDHHDDLEKEVTPKIDISDIDGLSDIPMIPGMDDSSTWLPDL